MNLLADLPPFLLADLLTDRFGESAGRFTPISAGRFTDCQQICWLIYPQYLLADLLTDLVNLLADLPPFLLADLLTDRIGESAGRFTPIISAGRFTDCQQICWLIYPQYLLADLLTDKFGESAGRFTPISAGRFTN